VSAVPGPFWLLLTVGSDTVIDWTRLVPLNQVKVALAVSAPVPSVLR
jgi:hypothetical protein